MAEASEESVAKRRYPYDCTQRVTPWYDGDDAVNTADADSVRSHDISVDGVSFFWPGKPVFPKLLISLGSGNERVLMAAEVCNSKNVFMHDEVQHLVGCRFLRRVEQGDAALTVERENKMCGV